MGAGSRLHADDQMLGRKVPWAESDTLLRDGLCHPLGRWAVWTPVHAREWVGPVA